MKRGRTESERAEMYRRQLGGTNAALKRARQRSADLEGCIRELVLAAFGSEMTNDEYDEVLEIADRYGVKVEVGA